MYGWWIRTNTSVLASYWYTTRQALQKVPSDPEAFAEFNGGEVEERFINAAVSNHLERHNYAGVLLCYALFDEFMLGLTDRLGKRDRAPITPRARKKTVGFQDYKKFVEDFCEGEPRQVEIDWGFLADFAEIRHTIIHANGLLKNHRNPDLIARIVKNRSPHLSIKHGGRLVVTEDYVADCVVVVRQTAQAVHGLGAPSSPG